MDVVPDIAFDWLMVEGSTCSDCEGNKYDISNNIELGTANKISEEPVEFQYLDSTVLVN